MSDDAASAKKNAWMAAYPSSGSITTLGLDAEKLAHANRCHRLHPGRMNRGVEI